MLRYSAAPDRSNASFGGPSRPTKGSCVFKMTSSLRECSLDETLAKARRLAPRLGISRVTDTTWLDRIGIPVYASIRPGAAKGSLCVNAGKGLRPKEAQVGAYMEAIEFACAEFEPGRWEIVHLRPHEIAEQTSARFRFVDLCPRIDQRVDPDKTVPCVWSEDLETGEKVLIPAELVFSPFPYDGQRIFGSSTNGLCSGNSLLEATVHGVNELIERDVHALNLIKDTSRFVVYDEPAGNLAELMSRVQIAGLQAVLRVIDNEFGLPFFQGYVLEPEDDAPIAISFGAGLHLARDIAGVRAMSEAAQSRLSYIHGGRDDLIDRYNFFDAQSRESELDATRCYRRRVTSRVGEVRYAEIADHFGAATSSLDAALVFLRNRLVQQGIGQILRVDLSPGTSSGLHVAKIIAPGLESYQPALQRVGPRLGRLVNRESLAG